MRSIKFLVATALVAALVAGPVLAQDAMTGSTAPAADAPAKPATTHHKKHTGKKHHHSAKKATSSTTPAPATTDTPPAQ